MISVMESSARRRSRGPYPRMSSAISAVSRDGMTEVLRQLRREIAGVGEEDAAEAEAAAARRWANPPADDGAERGGAAGAEHGDKRG